MAQLTALKEGDSVTIHLSSNNGVLHGLFYSFDPESESVILQHSDGHLMWINGHSIKSIKLSSQRIEKTDRPLQLLLIGKIEHKSKQILRQKEFKNVKLSAEVCDIQKRLMEYLGQHYLSPTLETKTNRIKIGSDLYIIPPYSADCCRSNNEIILSTTVNLLNKFHSQSNPKKQDEVKHDTDSKDLLEID